LFVGTLLGIVLPPLTAAAYCRTTTNDAFVPTASKPCDTGGTPLFWASKCLGFSVQRDASNQVDLASARAIAGRAFAEWSRHDCSEGGPSCGSGKPSITVSDLGPVTCDEVGYSAKGANANIVAFRDGVWPHDGTALALTTVTYKRDTGEIFDADVEVQSNPKDVLLATRAAVPSNQYDLESILVHEAGHVLGLAHAAPNAVTATMYASYRAGQTFMRDLAADDICGICAAFPPSREAFCDPTPRGGLADQCGVAADSGGGCALAAGPSGVSAIALLPLALAVAARVRRKRLTAAS
jgi:hypothetical protein